jgi:hypothetical protein
MERVMIPQQRRELRRLEGRMVYLALVDGSRIDDVCLVSARSGTVWLFLNGEDTFVPTDDVIDVWESEAVRSAA